MIASFLVEEGDLTGLVLSLNEGKEWILGRDPEKCDLLLEDPETDRIQLRCTHNEGQYFVENLSTTRAVIINGQVLAGSHKLVSGDRLAIGRTVLAFSTENEADEESEVLLAEDHQDMDIFDDDQDVVHESLSRQPSKEEQLEADQEESEQQPEEAHFDPTEETENPQEEPHLESEKPEAANQDPMSMFHPVEEFHLDLTPSSRFILKVIAGPNTGAEFAVDIGKQYLVGTDTTTCDIIFHDLSVSREHARLVIGSDGGIVIEDLGSRNGVVVDQKRIKDRAAINTNSIVTVGTTSFFFIDKEAPQETIATPVLEPTHEEEAAVAEPQIARVEGEQQPTQESQEQPPQPQKEQKISSPYLSGALVLSLIVIGFVVLMTCGVFSLSKSKEAFPEAKTKDLAMEVQEALKDFPGVRYTFNRSTRQLFLLGHVSTAIESSELLYNLQALTFLRGVQNNVVNDEAIWQEMNLLLSKIPEFKGVSMHSSNPGVFVLSGYLKTETQGADLMDYMNLHFNYLDLLDNRVVVEQEVYEEISSQLFQKGFGSISVVFLNGDLTLTGYIGIHQEQTFKQLLEQFQNMPGVRHVQNYIVIVTPEQQVIDLSQRYPSRYNITGYSKHGDVNINVVINGKILMRGDTIDEMTITSIQPHAVFLEKDGLKYKIEYNK